ncbi:MAG: CBASS cGAMP-activated phospholipase [bacterium]|nr:CBASS cGAMP-activated phospholipase [bacterium]
MTSEANGHGYPPWEGRCQVLSLDGGGLRGIFTAASLAALEDDLGSPVVDHFDLIAGTSTGGLIALALGTGMSARSILDFYLEEGPRIFRYPLLRTPRHLLRSKYDGRALEAAVRRQFGDRLLGSSKSRLVIPAFDLTRNDVYLFKTPHHPRLRRDWRVPMWEVAMSTSGAPTYLPAHVLQEDRTMLVDGGIWANNPCLVGLTEAVSVLKAQLADIRVLSIGTTSEFQLRPRSTSHGGIFQWTRKNTLVDVLLSGQSSGAFATTGHLLGADSVMRINPAVPPRLLRIDRLNPDDAVGWASGESRRAAPDVKDMFFDHCAKPFESFVQPKEVSNV